MVDRAFSVMREGIAIARWLAGVLESVRGDQPKEEQQLDLEVEVEVEAGSASRNLSHRSRGSEFNVFVSHAVADGQIAERIAKGLQAVGYSSWYAEWELQAGDSIVERIQAALSASDVLIVVLSPRSVTSGWVNREISSVLMDQLGGQSVPVIPVLIETCEIPKLLTGIFRVDLRDDFETGFLKLLDALRAHRNRLAGS